MKKILALILALVMALSLVACAQKAPTEGGESAEPITISLCHSYTDMDQVTIELQAACDAIKERTNGAVVINQYPNNTFGSMSDGIEALMADSPLMLVTSFGQWKDTYFDGGALQCGFVWEKGEEFLEFMGTDMFQRISSEMDAVGIHPLKCALVGGMRHVIGQKAYTTPEEIKGLKIRVPNSDTYLDCFNAMGASPMGLDAGQQMAALSAGTVDALDQSISLMYSTKSYEVVKHVSLIGQQPLADALFCSSKWWATVPAEYQSIIDEELYAAAQRYNQYCVDNEGAMRAEMEAAGVEFHEVDRDAFKALAGDLVLKYSIGQELLDTLAEMRAK